MYVLVSFLLIIVLKKNWSQSMLKCFKVYIYING